MGCGKGEQTEFVGHNQKGWLEQQNSAYNGGKYSMII